MGSPPPQNPFAMFGPPGAGAGAGGQSNPFAALFGGGAGGPGAGMPNPFGPPPQANPSSTSTPPTEGQGQNAGQQQQGNLFGGPFGAGAGNQINPLAQMTQQMMQNPAMMQLAMQNLGLGAGGAGQGAGLGGFDAFGMGGGQTPQAPQPQDSRPPEEQYSEQLRQLNDMGFYEFERNVRALRMAGGNVQGAVEFLLGGT